MLKRNQIVTIVGIFLLILCITVYLLFFRKGGGKYVPAAYAMPESAVMAWQGTDALKNFSAIENNELFKVFLTNKKGSLVF